MRALLTSPYRKWILLGLAVQVVAAWFSVGYHHPDEHFQILEFCNYKLGFSPASDLPWEYAAKCRSAVMPFLVYLLSKGFLLLHVFDPFVVAFTLRLLMGIATWAISCQLISIFLPEFATQKGKHIYVVCSMLLWYVPYIGVRFSSENFAGLLFFASIIMLLRSGNVSLKKKAPVLLLIGLLLGIAVFVRLQMAFAVIGLGVWLIFIKKYTWREILMMVPGAAIAVALCILADYWMYGVITLTPLNYYTVNIVQNVAANWGVFPWWYYVWLFLQSAVIPISIALLLLFFTGVRKRPLHLFSLVCILFLIGHSLVGHKEMRFLFPVNLAFIFLVCIGLDTLISRYGPRPLIINTFKFLAVINICLLIFKIFTPAQEAFKYYGYVYNFSKHNDTKLIALKESPYHLNGVEVNFFKPKSLQIHLLQNTDSIIPLLEQDKKHSLFFSSALLPQPTNPLQNVYCIFPTAILKYNINNWQQRSNIWAIYKAM
ncbi:MAG: hypothetical protein H0X33_13735 [Taibaiella sp.]|nr:hypothetical protein [Taibaiella sp.]